jgi:PAS domain S-box-containing protein
VSALATAAAGRAIRILHLEDDALDAALVEEAVRSEGLEARIVRVDDRAGFLDVLARGVDIVLSDYNLPSYDGLSALADARAHAPDAPFVFISGTLGEERAVETLKAGATDFVLKQHLSRLGPALRRALEEASERRARREAEAALEDSRQFVERVIEATPHIVYVFDPQSGSTVYLNQRISEVLGHTPEVLHAMGSAILSRLIHPDDMPRVRAAISGLTAPDASGVVESEYRVRDAGGRWRWLLTRSVPFRSPRGPGQILGSAEDITERRARERRRRAQYTVSRILAAETSLDRALSRIVEGLGADLGFALGEVWEHDGTARLLRRRAQWHAPGLDAREWAEGSAATLPTAGRGLPARVLEDGRTQWVRDVAEDPGFVRHEVATATGLRTAIAAPIRSGYDVLGVLTLYATDRLEVDDDLRSSIETLGGQIAEFWSRTRAQRALRESEEKFRSIVETTSEWIWAVDASFVHTYSNPAVKRILGYEPREIIGKHALALMHPDDREAVETELEGFAFQKRGWEGMVLRWRHRDGSTRYLESTALPVLDDEGRLAGYRGSDRDITARMETEEKLREQAMLLENAVEATLLTDTEGRIRFWNRGAADLYEWPAEEAMGRNIAELFASESAGAAKEARRRVLEGASWSGLVHQRSRSGRDIVVQSRWSPIRGNDGLLRSILILNSDVTEAQKLEARFLRAQRMEGIGTLAGGIAHDLNNVLAPILMSIEVLGRKVSDPHGQRMLGILETSARRGADLVKQVLTFSRGAQGPAGLLDPSHIVREMERMARETFPKSIRVQVDVANDLWQVVGQATPLQQVLMNLCVNARDAMPAGGTLTLRARNETIRALREAKALDPAPHVVLEVADTGTGIAPDLVDRIFDPFFTTKPVGLGTGLGLSTTAAIVKSHGGFIDLDTALGRGTTFKVFLPARLSAAAATPPADPELPEGRGELVLVIDDEAAILNIARETLESYGYTVLTAASGDVAVEIFRERHQDVRLVLTDMSMPGLSGAQTIRALRALDPGVPIVATSGRAMDEDVSVSGFLAKPYSGRTLLETVQAAMGAPPARGPGGG